MKPTVLNSIFRAIFHRREAVANDAETPREAAIANAADAPIDGGPTEDGWIKIAPYGVYPGSVPGRQQHFTEVEANAIVAQFRSFLGKAGRMFRGIPIYIGHPDQNPQLYTDHRRLGRLNDLQVRADGLYGEPQWNDLGEQNQREGYWVYPSPRWDAPAGRSEFRPDRLISVGLTNMPRITTSDPVTNSLDSQQTTATTEIMDRKLLTEKLGLDVTATDEEIMAKLASLMSEADSAKAALLTKETEASAATTEAATFKAEAEKEKEEKTTIANSLAEAQAKIITFESALQASREAYANALLDAAEASGRISKAERTEWLPKLTGDSCETEANALAGIAPKLNTQSLDVSQSRIEIGDEKSRRETISNAIDARMQKGMSYHEAWTDAKRDAALKPVFDAMKSPE